TGMSGFFAINTKATGNLQFYNSTKTINTTSSYYKGNAIQAVLKNKIKLGDYGFSNCPVVISVEDGNRIGSGLFQYFTLTFDQKNKTFSLSGNNNNFIF